MILMVAFRRWGIRMWMFSSKCKLCRKHLSVWRWI